MNMPPRHLPRFLPTLTEVVHPADLAAQRLAPVGTLESPVFAMQQTGRAPDNTLTPEVIAMVNSVVAEHMQVLHANLRLELEVMAKHAVQEAMDSKPASY